MRKKCSNYAYKMEREEEETLGYLQLFPLCNADAFLLPNKNINTCSPHASATTASFV